MLVCDSGQTESRDVEPLRLRRFEAVRSPSVTDQIFATLYNDVVTLALPPGSKLSEVEVSRQFDVSRQPVRDAFYRLSQLGFPRRPSSAGHDGQPDLRGGGAPGALHPDAIEIETARVGDRPPDRRGFRRARRQPRRAGGGGREQDRIGFHGLDDDFHRRICEMAGLDFAWSLIRDTKAQMDRVRFLSLAVGARERADRAPGDLRGAARPRRRRGRRPGARASVADRGDPRAAEGSDPQFFADDR